MCANNMSDNIQKDVPWNGMSDVLLCKEGTGSKRTWQGLGARSCAGAIASAAVVLRSLGWMPGCSGRVGNSGVLDADVGDGGLSDGSRNDGDLRDGTLSDGAMSDGRMGDGGRSDSDVDSPPSYSGSTNLWILEGSEGHLFFQLDEGGGPEEDVQTVSLTVQGTSDEDLLPMASVSARCEDRGDGCSGHLVVVPRPGKLGSGQVFLDVTDGTNTVQVTLDVVVEGTATGGSLKYVSASADGQGDGSRNRPWTMGQANANASAGDTVVILPGQYHQGVSPQHDGLEGAPIRFVAEARRSAVVVDTGNAGALLDLGGRSYIQVVGMRFESAGPLHVVNLDGSDHIRIEDTVALGAGVFQSAYVDIQDAQDIDLVDSRFERAFQNLFRVRNVRNYRVLGTVVDRAGHAPMFQDTGMQNVIFRGSASMGIWGRASGFSAGPRRLLFEHNVVSGSRDAGRSAGSDFKVSGDGAIYRFNRAYDNGPSLFTMRDYRAQIVIRHVRFYGNVFHDIVDRAFWINRKGDGTFQDVRFQNNVFLDNDRFGIGYHVRGSQVQGLVSFTNNVFFWPGFRDAHAPRGAWCDRRRQHHPGSSVRRCGQERLSAPVGRQPPTGRRGAFGPYHVGRLRAADSPGRRILGVRRIWIP